jgi:lipid-binding SYLF domain-containing protein
MKRKPTTNRILLGLSAVALLLGGCATSNTGDALAANNEAQLNAAANFALQNLYRTSPTTKELASQAKAILVFPDVLKDGFRFGGELANGVLRQDGRTTGFYNLTASSYGFEAGLQNFGYALFLMNDAVMDYLRQTGGWEIGTGPSVVILDEAMARTVSTTTARDDVYGFVFAQTGPMGGVGLQGAKLTRLSSSPTP